MYKCKKCGDRFQTPDIVYESYNLDTPPYDRKVGCPACSSRNIDDYKPTYCANCGIEISDGETYCSNICSRLGEAARAREYENRRIVHDFDISRAIREVDSYNKEHSTKYSYGQYFALKGMGKLDDAD